MRKVGWRTHISREVSSPLPQVGIGLSQTQSGSKLKLKKRPLAQTEEQLQSDSLTPLGRAVGVSLTFAEWVRSAPRVMAHAAVIGAVGFVVLSGSTSHQSQLNPLANQVGFGSVLEKAAAAGVAADVATQTDLLVTPDVSSDAKALNAQATLAVSDDGTLANRQLVDTAGAATRGIQSYQVKEGDTLGTVAASFNITTDTLRWANGLGADAGLKPGQALVILPISGIQHKVAAGDTPEILAARYQSNPEQIIAFNNAEVSGLKAGSTIVIPDGVIQEARPAAAAAISRVRASGVSSPPVRFVGGGANGYSYGYCTWYVASRRSIPSNWGNAATWYGNAMADGYGVGSTPRPGAVAWGGGGYYGHVAYVESVSGGMVTVSEMNYNGNWNRVTYRTVPASFFRYIY